MINDTAIIGVSILLMNDKCQYLGVSRKTDHSDWGLPGGKVDPEDNSFPDALVRELREETGLVVDPSTIREVYRTGVDTDHVDIVYVGTAEGVVKHDEPHKVKFLELRELFEAKTFGKFNTDLFRAMGALRLVPSQITIPD